jgi:hypothetical protein
MGRVQRVVVMVIAITCAWLLAWVFARAFDVFVTRPEWPERIHVATAVAAAAVGLVVIALARAHSRPAADVLVVATAAAIPVLGTLGLHGTRWPVNALQVDPAFRSEMAMRYTEGPALQDYAYQGLHAYYPPALGWTTGRFAVVSDLAGWEAMKPVHLLLGAAVPLLAYVLWRKLLTPLPAALVVAISCLVLTDPQRPDEWLVLACGVPWWLAAFRRAEREDEKPWAPWQHGVVAGLLLLTHTYVFLPLAVATVLGVGCDFLRRREMTLPWRSVLTIVAVGLLISSVYWYGVVVDRLSFPSDNLQMRHTVVAAGTPPWPLPLSLTGVLGSVGVLWLVLRARSERIAAALLLLLIASYATVFGGALLKYFFQIPLLAQKVDELVTLVYLVAGVLAIVDAVALLARRSDDGRLPVRVASGLVTSVAGALGLVVIGVPAALHASDTLTTGTRVQIAHTTRYPDGTYPEGRQGRRATVPPGYVLPTDAPVDEIVAAWHRLSGSTESSDSDTVLVTTRVDLLATTTFHPFTVWKSIFSHPNGQFNARIDVLLDVTDCPNSRCAADLLRDNPYDSVDGLVLRAVGDHLVMPYAADDWPRPLKRTVLSWPRALFAGPEFAVQELGQTVVIALR